MGKFNAALRTIALLALVSIGGWWTIFLRDKINEHEKQLLEKEEKIEELGIVIEEREREIVEIKTSLALLKVSRRLARIEVLDQTTDEADPNIVRSRVRFTEVDEEGEPLATPMEFDIEGRELYLDALVIKFEDDYIEKGDALRGSSVSLFRRAFGENQSPSEGVALDRSGARPQAYSGDDLPDPFHTELWQRFWDYANDEELRAEKGVRAVHGEAPFVELRQGKTYRVELRASGGLTIQSD